MNIIRMFLACFLAVGVVAQDIEYGADIVSNNSYRMLNTKHSGWTSSHKTSHFFPLRYVIYLKSYPMHYQNVSSNYALLPHNIDPSIPTPDEYKGMPIQPLGNKQAEYEQRIQRCINHYGRRGNACLSNEKDRIDMSLRQPQVGQES